MSKQTKKKGPKRRRVKNIDKRSCDRKIKYETKGQAWEAMMRNHKDGRLNIHYYHCSACDNFHLGHRKSYYG